MSFYLYLNGALVEIYDNLEDAILMANYYARIRETVKLINWAGNVYADYQN